MVFIILQVTQKTVAKRNCARQTCFSNLGCFSSYTSNQNNKAWIKNNTNTTQQTDDLNRFSLRQLLINCPISPDDMNVSFILFRNHTNKGIISKNFAFNSPVVDIMKSNLSINQRTVIITHGWFDYYGNRQWMDDMRDYFLGYNFNVIIYDWKIPASDDNYFNSAFNTQIVGSMLAYFIRTLNTMGVNLQNIHLIGHSLGAHVCGFAGKNFTDPKIGQISGLDPAGFGFWSTNKRLLPSDAKLVVVTHTSGGLTKWDGSYDDLIQMSGYLGQSDSLGHYDFRPNGGTGQPGCISSISSFIANMNKKSDAKVGDCNHQRVHQLLIANRKLRSTNSCKMIGYHCDSYNEFLKGNCADCGSDGQRCKPVEFDINYWKNPINDKNLTLVNNNYYFLTTDTDPYCLFHYQIVIYINKKFSYGYLNLTLILNPNNTVEFTIHSSQLKINQSYNHLYTSAKHLGVITSAEMTIKKFGIINTTNDVLARYNLSSITQINVTQIDIKFMSSMDKKERQKYSAQLNYLTGNTNTTKFAINNSDKQ
ncbi:pancreatic lipase-related protein 2-like [Oppia nitens]|uniref:pancreatic lipase-related protein 2-like n=1 Tax=Oppia nitens TaxID=1686743 RepID=UPI0023D9F49B|nr:pancreatic lipase-related protein 2-like [Oppia nitens]